MRIKRLPPEGLARKWSRLTSYRFPSQSATTSPPAFPSGTTRRGKKSLAGHPSRSRKGLQQMTVSSSSSQPGPGFFVSEDSLSCGGQARRFAQRPQDWPQREENHRSRRGKHISAWHCVVLGFLGPSGSSSRFSGLDAIGQRSNSSNSLACCSIQHRGTDWTAVASVANSIYSRS